MRKSDEEIIISMRLRGKGATEISRALGMSVNTVRSYIRRHPLPQEGARCPNCGRPVQSIPGYRKKIYCSDKCRMAWWNSHRDAVCRKAFYSATCRYCGKEFSSYANSDRKYCSRDCYYRSRAVSAGEAHAVSADACDP